MANDPQTQTEDQAPAPQWRGRSLAIVGVCGIFVWVAALVLYGFPASDKFRLSSLSAAVAGTKDRPVDIQASLSQNLFEDERTQVPVTVSIVNRGTVALSDVMVCAEAPGFELKREDNCVTENRLEPLGRKTRQIPITALDHSSLSMITVRVFWRQGTAEMSTLRLGPVKIDPSLGAMRWNRFGQRLASIFKDLTWPVILALLGAWLNRKQEEREQERQRIERDVEENREKNEKEAEKKREDDATKLSDRQQVRLLLLEKVMRLAEEYYLPIAAQVIDILIEAERIEQKETLKSPDKLFFHLLMLLRLDHHMSSSKQVVFLQKRSSEEVVARSLEIARYAAWGAMGEELVMRALMKVGVDWNFATFKDHKDELSDLQAAFNEWLAGTGKGAAIFGRFADYLGVLDVLKTVVQCEADRPLSPDWYDEPPRLTFWFRETIIPAGKKLPTSQRASAEDLKVFLDAYLKAFNEDLKASKDLRAFSEQPVKLKSD